MNSVRTSRSLRAMLLTTAAGACLAMAPAAHADIAEIAGVGDIIAAATDPTTDPESQRLNRTAAEREAQNGTSSVTGEMVSQNRTGVEVRELDPQIVIGHPGTPTTARDPVNITGVGQMIVDQGGGFVGLCTASLINPRTVIFAAHCVNTNSDDGSVRPATAYGANSGGIPIGFGFETNLRANGPGQTDELIRWLFGGTGGAGQHQSNTAQHFYNADYVYYHPRSTEPNADRFLYADIATASLDTPARGVPTWAMLFSALPDPGTIGANGTGYHVNLVGYGNNGTGAAGSVGGIDFRRRLAENMLGALASLDDFEFFLFGTPPNVNDPDYVHYDQNLYWIDFDDPRRGTAQADPRDFNAWRDNPQPNEGITASGDSGGPLILDRTYARQLIIGVLSGGYTRFFTGAPPNGYGTASFYQPLYLYWDWVAANNPYHYVSALAGNGNWTDPTHWVSNVDPNYFIIGPDGQIVNGVPTTEGQTTTNLPGFGQACLEGPVNGGFSECQDIATGTYTLTVRPIGTDGDTPGAISDGSASVHIGDGSATTQVFDVEPDAQATGNGNITTNALPAPTIDNGLPGATNFVPNNTPGDRLQGIKPRYFDVTLSANGTTTLDTSVTIDRLGIAGSGAVLNITSTGGLISLMEVNQITGTVQVNGTLQAVGDYFMLSGGLNGAGTIRAPFFTSVAGTISPGTVGTAGTIGALTFRGNVILSSGNIYRVDLGANGSSDQIVVRRVGGSGGVTSLGGNLVLNFSAETLRGGNSYTILTSEGGFQAGSRFFDPNPLSAILTPRLSYSNTAVTLTIQAGLYGNIIPASDTVAFPYAILLDRNRGQAANYDALYGPLDLQDAATIRSTLQGLRPANQTTVQTLGLAGVDAMAGFIGNRVNQLEPGSEGGTFARYGSPNQIAAIGLSSRGVAGLSGMGFDSDVRGATATESTVVQEGVLPEGTAGYVAGGYLRGDGASATGLAGRDDYDGWFVAGGIETWDDSSAIGFAFSYTRLDGQSALAGNSARASIYQGSLYGKTEFGNGFVLDTNFTAGLLDGSTRRAVNFLGTPYVLRSQSGSLIVVGETGLGNNIDIGAARITPRVALRGTHIGFSSTREEGGPMALAIDRAPINSIQGRAGLTFAGTGAKVRPMLSATYVHEFRDRSNVIGANLIGGVGGNVLFDLNTTDRDYFEVGGGLTIDAGAVSLSVSAETTIDRQDYQGQVYRGSISFKF